MSRDRAVVTGASRGIGRACAEALFRNGYEVTGTYLRSEESAHELEAMGISMVRCDVRSYDDVHQLAERLSGTEILVNNAGIAQEMLFTDITEEMWDDMFAVNCKGAYNFIHAFLPSMIHRKYGRIVNISSVWGEVGASCEVHYSASKAALIGLTRALAKETGPSGITVNCITPGVIDTDMNKCYDEQTMRQLAEETPLCRLGTAEDVANAVVFLCSREASFITGEILGVNGGFGR